MIKYTTSNLKKLESLFKELGYSIRHGKGNFKSGYCILESKRVIVLNKFTTTESKISSLIDILGQVDIENDQLKSSSKEFLNRISDQIKQS